jgi:ParB family chromosome partitioning protein
MHEPRGRSFPVAASCPRAQMDIALDDIVPDSDNRPIDETDDSFAAFADSIRLFGVLQRVHVRSDGAKYELIDGERRWRAARRVGIATIPCEVWPASATQADVVAAGIVLNEQRQAHSCIRIGRRLRDLCNAEGLTGEQVACPIAAVRLRLIRGSRAAARCSRAGVAVHDRRRSADWDAAGRATRAEMGRRRPTHRPHQRASVSHTRHRDRAQERQAP